MGRLEFLYRLELPHRAKLVYIYLYDRMDKERKAWPGLNTIARDLSLSRSTVKRAVKDLEAAGLYKKSRTTVKTAVRPLIGIIYFDRLKRSISPPRGTCAYSLD